MTPSSLPIPDRGMLRTFEAWSPDSHAARGGSFHGYVQAIAHARFVMRRILRILDDQARERGLEPMQHQALLQVYSGEEGISVTHLADRLSVVGAHSSRLVTQLESRGLVCRRHQAQDRRIVHVHATEAGIALLREIDSAVYRHIRYFQEELSETGKLGALGIFAFYVGLDSDSVLASHLRESLRAALGDTTDNSGVTS